MSNPSAPPPSPYQGPPREPDVVIVETVEAPDWLRQIERNADERFGPQGDRRRGNPMAERTRAAAEFGEKVQEAGHEWATDKQQREQQGRDIETRDRTTTSLIEDPTQQHGGARADDRKQSKKRKKSKDRSR